MLLLLTMLKYAKYISQRMVASCLLLYLNLTSVLGQLLVHLLIDYSYTRRWSAGCHLFLYLLAQFFSRSRNSLIFLLQLGWSPVFYLAPTCTKPKMTQINLKEWAMGYL